MKRKVILWSIGGFFGLAILIGLAWPSITVCGTPSPQAMMQALYAQISLACQHYKQEYGTYPELPENKTLIAVLTGENPRKIVFFEPNPKQLNEQKEILDMWGTPIRIALLPDTPPSFVSAGKDKTFGTSDDIKDKR